VDDERATPKPPTLAQVEARYLEMTGQALDGGYLALACSVLGVDPPQRETGDLEEGDDGDQGERRVDLDLNR